MIHADLSLGLRLEGAAIAIESQYARAHAALRPDLDIELASIADGVAIFAGIGSPMSQTTGLGLRGPIAESDFEAIEDFYFRRKATARIIVCPLADDSLFETLNRRGYRLGEFESTLVRPLEDVPESSHSPAIKLTLIGAEDADRYAETVGPNFTADGVLSPEMREMMSVIFGTSCGMSVLAEVEGQGAGGGSLLMHEGVAMLAGAGTLPKFRNKGVHAALFDHRLILARETGCDLAVMGAKPGSTSQKNAERKGFLLVYTKCVMVREPG
jgi:GNAT superfamily N-acetyltransferase